MLLLDRALILGGARFKLSDIETYRFVPVVVDVPKNNWKNKLKSLAMDVSDGVIGTDYYVDHVQRLDCDQAYHKDSHIIVGLYSGRTVTVSLWEEPQLFDYMTIIDHYFRYYVEAR